MKCKEIQDQLLLGGLDESMEAHLQECSECKEFSKIVGVMNDVQQPGPSAALDAKVLTYARENRPSKKQPIPFYIFTAVAAMLIIAFSVMFFNGNQKSVDEDPGLVKNPETIEKTVEQPNKMLANSEVIEKQELDQALDTLWDDDIMNADITAIEGELFVLSAELYSN